MKQVGYALLGLLLATAALAADERLDDAIELFNRAEFAKARDRLVGLSDAPNLSDASRQKALTYLAASYHALGDSASAKAQLKLLARRYPKAKVDPDTFLPEVIALWKQARREVAQEPPASPPMPPPPVLRPVAPPTPTLAAPAPRPLLPPPPPLGMAFVPFGVGQFANRQPGKGALFLTGEVAAFGTFAVAVNMLERMKVDDGNRSIFRSGTIPPEKWDTANALNVVQVAAFWTGVALAAGGVLDAVVSRPSGQQPTVAVAPNGIAVRF